jgi:ADP-ribose pyrophosphatase YjhB (NUDIX family)
MKDKWLKWASELQSIAQAGFVLEHRFKENTETLEAGFFSYESLPPLSTNRNTRSQIEMCFEAKKYKVFETIFD